MTDDSDGARAPVVVQLLRHDVTPRPTVTAYGRSSFSDSSSYVLVRWALRNSYDIIWSCNTFLSTMTTLGILLNMFLTTFTMGSMLIDVLILILFPLNVLVWEVLLYFGDHNKSVILLGILFVLNGFPFIVAVYVLSQLWHYPPYSDSRVVFAIILILAHTVFVIVSGAYLYWKICGLRLENTIGTTPFRNLINWLLPNSM